MKKFVSFLLISTLVLSNFVNSYADQNSSNYFDREAINISEDNDQLVIDNIEEIENNRSLILDLLEELAESRVKELLDDDNSMEIEITSKLNELGAQILTQEEVKELIHEDNYISPFVSRPNDTYNVTWCLYPTYVVSRNSQTYEIQNLVAVGRNGGVLTTRGENEVFYTNQRKSINTTLEVFSIYM